MPGNPSVVPCWERYTVLTTKTRYRSTMLCCGDYVAYRAAADTLKRWLLMRPTVATEGPLVPLRKSGTKETYLV